MLIREIMNENGRPYEKPKFEVYVGGHTQSVTNPFVTVWSGITIQDIVGVDWAQVFVSGQRDVRKNGLKTIFSGTYQSTGEPEEVFGSWKWPLVKIAEFTLDGDLNRKRKGVQMQYDGFYWAESSFAGEGVKYFGSCFGNYTFSPNPTPSPWPNPAGLPGVYR